MTAKLPYVPLELLEYLEALAPDRMPTSFENEFYLGKQVGRVEMVRKLRQLYEDQVKASLTSGLKEK